jgi:hypothetical protein
MTMGTWKRPAIGRAALSRTGGVVIVFTGRHSIIDSLAKDTVMSLYPPSVLG